MRYLVSLASPNAQACRRPVARFLANFPGYSDLLDSARPLADTRSKMFITTSEEASPERNRLMRARWISALLLTASCCLTGCASFSGTTGHAGVGYKGGVIQKGPVSQKGDVVQKGHVYQKGPHQKGVAQKSVMHQNLWNQYEPSACCDSWDPVLGSTDACGVCGGTCQGHTPAQHMKYMLTCASGCGEIYWGEWFSDPPDDCDPCDDWGHWIGPVDCSGPSCLESVASGWCNLWGYRNGGGKGGKGQGGCVSCGGKGGCDSCGGEAKSYYDIPMDEEGGGTDVPTPEIEALHRPELLPRAVGGFSIRSARLTR